FSVVNSLVAPYKPSTVSEQTEFKNLCQLNDSLNIFTFTAGGHGATHIVKHVLQALLSLDSLTKRAKIIILCGNNVKKSADYFRMLFNIETVPKGYNFNLDQNEINAIELRFNNHCHIHLLSNIPNQYMHILAEISSLYI